MAELPTNAQAINAQASSEPNSPSQQHFPAPPSSETTPNGGKSWNIFHGTLATGETIAIHESQQPAGTPPNPPHQIGTPNSFSCVRERSSSSTTASQNALAPEE